MMEWPPHSFLQKMSSLLGEEFEAFEEAFNQRPYSAIRTNTLKLSSEQLQSLLPWSMKLIGSYEPDGFRIDNNERLGRHPAHAAGLFYIQEPSAMSVARFVDPQPGEWVLDLAAAPGGKATHLAALMQGEGLLVANDLNRQRALILSQNLERWGAQNCIITSSPPEKLANSWGASFDRVLMDAPCSGEGMFRKQGPFEWDEGIVEACARRQTAVLDTAAQLVRPGGRLVYSTCTFSPEENEQVIVDFLQAHPEFDVETAVKQDGMSDGRPEWASPPDERLARTVRLWPHLFAGEGHFVAVLKRRGEEHTGEGANGRGSEGARGDGARGRVERGALAVWRAFERDVLQFDVDEARLGLVNGRLYQLPTYQIDTRGVRVVRNGIALGEVRKGRLIPAHGLALTLKDSDVKRALNLAMDDSSLQAYLQGQLLDCKGEDGWVLITAAGFGLGWGKRVNGRVKNHYPRGLRQV